MHFRNNVNDATRHQGVYQEAWGKIKALEGTVVPCSSAKDGTVEWKVVEKVTKDDFAEVRESEEKLYNEEYCTALKDIAVGEKGNYSDLFWHLWPGNLNDDISAINAAIMKENICRKSRYQRPIRVVSKEEYVTFHALLIGASAHTEQGEKLWPDTRVKNKVRSVFRQVDFGEYMKSWRFKEIKGFIRFAVADETRKDRDDWWQFSAQIESFNKKRKEALYASHVLVFDESMSAFVPR